MLKQIVYSSQKEIKTSVTALLLEAFPEEERPPVPLFFKNLQRKANRLIAFYNKKDFIGFTYLTFNKDICYIFFLAVEKEHRNKGYGGQILEILKKDYQDYVLLLCYEEVNPQYPNYLERVKREQFYLSHGFKDNNLKTLEYGVAFQSVYYGNHKINFEDYKEIFKLAFGEGHDQHLKQL